jgi:hypothetical protein
MMFEFFLQDSQTFLNCFGFLQIPVISPDFPTGVPVWSAGSLEDRDMARQAEISAHGQCNFRYNP